MKLFWLACVPLAALALTSEAQAQDRARYEKMIAKHARANLVPEALVHRLIVRESKYHPDLVGHGGTIGLMQIKLATAKGVGYSGDADGLRDPETNLKYGVKYLAGAYRAAGGNESRAVALYSRGYYYQAKAQGFSPYASGTTSAPGFASYGAAYQPAYQTSFQSWPNQQYSLRHRRHYHA